VTLVVFIGLAAPGREGRQRRRRRSTTTMSDEQTRERPTPSSLPRGGRAITPYLNLDSTDESLPTFTAEDAAAYTLAYPPRSHVRGTPLKVKSVQFLTDAQADQVLHRHIGQPPDTLVCLVWVEGQFQVRLPFPGAKTRYSTGPAFIVYHARTGNVLVTN
jgi:hypothetical protein